MFSMDMLAYAIGFPILVGILLVWCLTSLPTLGRLWGVAVVGSVDAWVHVALLSALALTPALVKLTGLCQRRYALDVAYLAAGGLLGLAMGPFFWIGSDAAFSIDMLDYSWAGFDGNSILPWPPVICMCGGVLLAFAILRFSASFGPPHLRFCFRVVQAAFLVIAIASLSVIAARIWSSRESWESLRHIVVEAAGFKSWTSFHISAAGLAFLSGCSYVLASVTAFDNAAGLSCQRCGYDLRHLASSTRCPECGAPRQQKATR